MYYRLANDGYIIYIQCILTYKWDDSKTIDLCLLNGLNHISTQIKRCYKYFVF